jgi:hypothetical protein
MASLKKLDVDELCASLERTAGHEIYIMMGGQSVPLAMVRDMLIDERAGSGRQGAATFANGNDRFLLFALRLPDGERGDGG